MSGTVGLGDTDYAEFYAVTDDGVTLWHSGSWFDDEEQHGKLNSKPWTGEEDSNRPAVE